MGLSILVFVLFIFLMSVFVKIQSDIAQEGAQDTYLLWVVNQGYYQFRTEPFDWRTWQSSHKQGSLDYEAWSNSLKTFDSLVNEFNGSKIFLIKNFYINDFLENPYLKVRQVLTKVAFGQFFIANRKSMDFYSVFTQSGYLEFYLFHLFINIFNLIVLFFALFYFIRMFQFKNDDLFYLSLWLGFLIFHSFVYMEPRYMFAGRLVLILFALKYLSTNSFMKKWLTN